ncbi:MAG TPA: glycosyltransferase [Acidimicrobiales bacterium]|nr:glycosyltransferase [Acidimicrobiales bacterium]
MRALGRPGAGGATSADGAVMHFKADWLPSSEGFVYDLVRHLRRRPVIVGFNRLQNTDRFPIDDVHSLGSLDRYVRPVAARPIAFTAALGLLARRRRVALVHAHHGYRVEATLGLVRGLRLPLVLSLHGHDVTGYLEHVLDPYRETAAVVSAVVVPSRFLVEHAVAAGFDEERVRVMPSGIDTSFFSASPLPDGDPVVVFVGRFVAKKGLDTLAAAWPKVQSSFPAARLRLLGYGPLEPLARSIAGRVSVEIAPERRTVRDAIRGARVVVSPSHLAEDDAAESLLVVNLEAQASARPVVTTRHGGIPEYVRDGQTAIVIPENDPEALADAIAELLGDEELARRMGSAGPAWASRFDVRRTAAQMDSLYDELLVA